MASKNLLPLWAKILILIAVFVGIVIFAFNVDKSHGYMYLAAAAIAETIIGKAWAD